MSEVARDFNFLTPEERAQMKRFLMFPEEFPREFKDWLLQYVGLNANLQRSQVEGLNLYNARSEVVSTSASTTSATATALDGPVMSEIGRGQYLVFWGAFMGSTAADKTASMVLRLNDQDMSVITDPPIPWAYYYNGPGPGFSNQFVMASRLLDLTLPSNTLTAMYLGTGTSVFQNRIITILRTGSL